MLFLLEQILIHLFFVLSLILEGYFYFLIQMNRLTETDCEEIPLWGMPLEVKEPPVPVVQEVYQESKIAAEHEAFLNDIAQSLTDANCPKPDYPMYENIDILSMDAWMEEPAAIAVTPRLSTTATARIKDHLIGEQTWVVEVVGEEQEYIHISDGSARAWVNIEGFGHLLCGDILSLLVERSPDQSLSVQNVDILQRRSADFIIPDEDMWTEKAETAIA